MPTMIEQRDSLRAEAEALLAKSDMTEQDAARAEELAVAIDMLDARMKAAEEHSEKLAGFLAAEPKAATVAAPMKSFGEGFAKAFISATGGKLAKGQTFNWSTKDDETVVEPAAANEGAIVADPDVLGTFGYRVRESQFPLEPEATILDLFGQMNVTERGVEYLKWSFTGEPENIVDGGLKPQLTGSYEVVTVHVEEIGAHVIVSETMLADEPALAAKLNQLLVRRIRAHEQAQVLAGDGTRPNLLGLLNTDGVQELTATQETLFDQILKGIADVKDATDFDADVLALNPADWFTLRTAKDLNGQYLLGGPAYAPYGNGAVEVAPNPWGVRYVAKSSAVPQGTLVVGDFRNGATVYRRAGIDVAVSNSHDSIFVHDELAIRAFERVGFGVDYPEAFAVITLEDSGN